MQSELEDKLTHSYKEGMIAFLKSHPEHFDEAIALAISDHQPYAWRAAWLIWSCMDNDDIRIRKHIKEIVHSLKSKNDGHQRELLKILLQLNLNKKYSGSLFDLCVDVWAQIDKTPSVRFTALKFMIKVAKKHPHLSEEIVFRTQDRYLEPLSPAAKKSVARMMNELMDRNKGLFLQADPSLPDGKPGASKRTRHTAIKRSAQERRRAGKPTEQNGA